MIAASPCRSAGTRKTLVGKAVAHESEANCISAKLSSMLSKCCGESEKQISRLFQRARRVAPAVVLTDEIDSLAPQRSAGFTVTNRSLGHSGVRPSYGTVVSRRGRKVHIALQVSPRRGLTTESAVGGF